MDRRKFVLGLGSLAAGGAAAMGTGAFTATRNKRRTEVALEDDADAFLGLQPSTVGSSNNSQYAGDFWNNGQLQLALNGQSPGDGKGINPNGQTWFDNIFEIVNQTYKDQWVYVTGSVIKPGAGNTLVWAPYIGPNQGYNDRLSIKGAVNAVGLNPGDSASVGLYFDTRNLDDSRMGHHIVKELSINADDSNPGDGPNNADVPEP